MHIWGDDEKPTRRSDGIGYGALVILGLVFWLALAALDRELAYEAQAVREHIAQTDR